MVGTLTVQTIQGPTSGANANKVIIPSGQTLVAPGHVLNVWNVGKTDVFTTSSTSYVDITDMSITLTPQSATSKFLVKYNASVGMGADNTHVYLQLVRNSTAILQADAASNRSVASSIVNSDTAGDHITSSNEYLDSPATTSSITYKLQMKTGQAVAVYLNRSSRDTDLAAYDGRSSSSFTVMEIAG